MSKEADASSVILFPPNDPRLQRFRGLLRGDETEKVAKFEVGGQQMTLYRTDVHAASENALANMILFSGNAWSCVEWVALAFAPFSHEKQEIQIPVGIATLAPTDEGKEGGAHIIGVYVLSSHREDNGYELALVRRLVNESQRIYHQVPAFMPIPLIPADLELVKAVQEASIPLRIEEFKL